MDEKTAAEQNTSCVGLQDPRWLFQALSFFTPHEQLITTGTAKTRLLRQTGIMVLAAWAWECIWCQLGVCGQTISMPFAVGGRQI